MCALTPLFYCLIFIDRVKPANEAANRSELNPVHFLARSATVYPSKLAVIHGNRRYTYQELNRRSIAFAYALKEQLKIGRGDRVAIIAPNIPAMLEAHFGIPAANAVICAINTRLAPAEVAYILEHSGAKAVFCDLEYEALVKDSKLPKVIIEDSGLPSDPYEQFLQKGLSKADTLGWSGLDQTDDEEEAVSLCYTRYLQAFFADKDEEARGVPRRNADADDNVFVLDTQNCPPVERQESPRECFTHTEECTYPHWVTSLRRN
jgi:acyl-CoA synthetase (AMP-forming)/AMP-acid ligase II